MGDFGDAERRILTFMAEVKRNIQVCLSLRKK